MARKTDIAFKLDWVPHTYAARVQRAAVLYPLTGRPATNDAGVRRRTTRLLTIWRARVSALMSCGWHPPGTRMCNTYLRNCCPTFAFAMPLTRCCRLDYLCPFCYARRASELWESVDHAFPKPGSSEAIDEYGRPMRAIRLSDTAEFAYHLVERRRVVVYPWLPAHAEERSRYPTEAAWVRYLMTSVCQQRAVVMRKLVRSGTVCGALFFTTVEACHSGWRFTHRQLFQIPAKALLTLESGKYRRHVRPSRSVVCQAVIRTLRYPRQLLSGDVRMTAELLAARAATEIDGQLFRGARMLATYGRFRRRRVS
jgi:hypothetical protein